jgi:multiple sugar transport system permease protein
MNSSTLSVVRSGPSRLDGHRYRWESLLLLLPAAALLIGLFIAPIFYAGYLGMTNLQLIGSHAIHYTFTGLWNVHILLSDDEFWHSLLVTIYFVVGSGAMAATVAGLVLAMLMDRAIPMIQVSVGALAMLACILPPATVAVLWFCVSTAGGVLPWMLGQSSSDLLFKYPIVIVSAANAWSLCGLTMLMFAAALKNIPQDMYEAAILEGSTAIQRFFRITLPMLRPTLMTSVLLMTLLSFGNFTLVFLMTGGGPGNATNILPVYAYMQGFRFNHLGYGAMLGNVMVLLSAALGITFICVDRLGGIKKSANKR